MKNLTANHLAELKASCISDAIIDRYFYSVDGAAAQSYLISDRITQLEERRDNLGGHAQQYATAPVIRINQQIERIEQQAGHVTKGGWVCTANGQLKANEPRQAIAKDEETGEYRPVFNADGSPKFIKYDSIREKPYKGAHVSTMLPEGQAVDDVVVVTEGAKKAAAAASLGYRSIGLPGVDMGSYRDADDNVCLIPCLQELAEAGATIAIAYDQDAQRNKRRGVAQSGIRLATAYEAAGGCACFVTWGHKSGKGLDDVVAAKSADFVHKAIADLKPMKAYVASLPKGWTRKEIQRTPAERAELARLEAYYKKLYSRPVADVVVNQRYLDRGTLIAPQSCQLVDSPVGTAKTSGYLAGAIEAHRKAFPEAWELATTFRNILLRQMGEELGFTHWQDVESDDYSPATVQYILACPESLPKLARHKIPDNSLVVVDEFMAWLNHAFTSDTMKGGSDRVTCIRAIQTIFQKVYDGGGSFICLEAGTHQAAVDCLTELLPPGCKVSILRNEFRHEEGREIFMYDSPNHLTELLIKRAAEGYSFIMASDAASYVDETLRPAFNGPHDFAVSARNSAEADAIALATKPTKYIAEHKINRLCHSPSLAAGSSITDPDAETQLFDFGGGKFTHLTSGAAIQQLDRYRRPVPLHVHVAVSGLGASDKDLSKLCPERIRETWKDNLEYSLELVKAADYLKQYDGGSLGRTLTKITNGEHSDIALIEKWASIFTGMARWDSLNLRENFIEKVESAGHTVHRVTDGPGEGVTETLKDLKETAIAEAAEEFAALEVDPLLSPEMARDVLSTHGHTRDEHLQAQKCLFVDEFPKADFSDADFIAEYVVRSKGKKLKQLRTEWAARNIDQAKTIDRWHLKNKIKQANSLGTGVAASDISTYSPEADVFAQMGLPEAIDEIADRGYTSDSKPVANIADWARKNKALLYKRARVKVDPEASNVKLFNALARKLGYLPKLAEQKGGDGQREKVYALADFGNPNRGHMLKSLTDKFSMKLEIKGETLDGKSLMTDPNFGNEQLAERAATAEAKPIKQPAKATELFTTDVPGDVLAAWFQDDLCKAETFQQLLDAKAKTPEATQRRVMALWEKDGRYQALAEKANRLKASTEMATAA